MHILPWTQWHSLGDYLHIISHMVPGSLSKNRDYDTFVSRLPLKKSGQIRKVFNSSIRKIRYELAIIRVLFYKITKKRAWWRRNRSDDWVTFSKIGESESTLIKGRHLAENAKFRRKAGSLIKRFPLISRMLESLLRGCNPLNPKQSALGLKPN